METYVVLTLLSIGLVAGSISGLIGIGAGVLIVPALTIFLKYSQHQAQGISLGLFLFPVGILAVLNYHDKGFVDFKAVGIMAIAFVIGGWIGSKASFMISETILRKIFAFVLFIVASRLMFFDTH